MKKTFRVILWALAVCMFARAACAMVADNYDPVKLAGNGTTEDFSFSWPIGVNTNLRVYLEDAATGEQTLQTLDTDYTVVFNDATPGGTVTFTTPPTDDYYVVIARSMGKTQDVGLTTSGGFQARVVESMADRLTMQVQDLQEQIDRAILIPVGSTEETPNYAEVLQNASQAAAAYADDAEDAQAAAEIAQAGAEAAAATAAADAASDVSDLLAGYVVDAQTAKTGAETAQGLAEDAQAAAEAAAAGVNLPSVVSGSAGKTLKVKTDESGYELSSVALPSGAVFMMLTGNCPAGTTDVTTSYANKFLMVGSDQGATGGSNTATLAEANLPSHNHSAGTLTTVAHNHGIEQWYGGAGESGLIAWPVFESHQPYGASPDPSFTARGHDSTAWHDVDATYTRIKSAAPAVTGASGSTGSGSSFSVQNAYVTCKLCQVN